jgi:CRP-like cAMP-binding protein
MLGEALLQPFPQARFASNDTSRAEAASPTPRQNRLLAALPLKDYGCLLPNLEPVSLPLGWTVHGAGDREKYLHFLTAGIVSRFYVMENGESADFAITGSEGVIGVASFLGGESTLSQAVVLSAGHAFRLRSDLVNREFKGGGGLLALLLRYTQALIAQTGQIAACNRHHSVEQRLCRWILSCLDRLSTHDLAMTQEQIADLLGVRREGITDTAQKLQQAGLIHYRRGRITVLDRPGLEKLACECYAGIKHEYDRLFPSPENSCASRKKIRLIA